MTGRRHRKKQFMCTFSQRRNELMNPIGLLSEVWMWCEIWLVQMGAEYKVHTKLLTEFETLGVMGENCSGIIIINIIYQSQNHKGCENLPSLHVWWVRRHHVIFRKNGFLTSRMTSQPLNRHTQWNNIFFPHIDVIHIVSEHLIGSLEESKVWFFLCKTAMFNY